MGLGWERERERGDESYKKLLLLKEGKEREGEGCVCVRVCADDIAAPALNNGGQCTYSAVGQTEANF